MIQTADEARAETRAARATDCEFRTVMREIGVEIGLASVEGWTEIERIVSACPDGGGVQTADRKSAQLSVVLVNCHPNLHALGSCGRMGVQGFPSFLPARAGTGGCGWQPPVLFVGVRWDR